jgi:hypothetical protein
MNQDERRIITEFVERVSGAAPAPAAGNGASSGGPWGGSSVPTTQQARPPLPPVDREADAMIAELFTKYPEARYRITQTAFVQEAALVEAQNRIRRLEWEVENAQRQAQAQQQQGGGLFGGMFGGGRQSRQPAPMPPPPQPVYPPGYNPGMLQQQQGRGGSGFLGTALTTAAGVAGGMVLGNMLMNSLSGGHGAAHAATPAADTGAAGAAGGFGQEAVPASSPWTDPGAAAASQGWGGEDGGAKSDWGGGGGADKFAGDQDASPAGYDDAGAMDDGGGYDEEI